MAGVSIVMMGMVMVLIFLVVLVCAIAMFIAATVITIIYVCKNNERKIKGEKLGGKIAIPIVLYVISTPIVLLSLYMFISSLLAGI